MRYRVVPLAAIARELGVTDTDTLEAVASDGFAAQLPGRLVLQQADTGPRAWLAIELPAEPWPPLPGKPASAGPFYVVWSDDTGIGPEQWPYMVVKLARRQPPEQRWPPIIRPARGSPITSSTAWPATSSTAPARPRSAPICSDR
jgi:hypothetical protein